MKKIITTLLALSVFIIPASGWTWHDETHLAIAKAAGYEKWYNATGADMAKIKAGDVENKNHYVNNPPGTVVTVEMIMDMVDRYNEPADAQGHLYGAIIASIRAYRNTARKGKYAEYHLAFCAHYLGDLSQPLHNTSYNAYNRQNHNQTDGVINNEVLSNLNRIGIYPIIIQSESDLAKEIAKIANLSLNLGYKLEKEGRMLSKKEAYQQISLSASLLKGVLRWLGK